MLQDILFYSMLAGYAYGVYRAYGRERSYYGSAESWLRSLGRAFAWPYVALRDY